MPNTVYAKEWPPYSHWHGRQTLKNWLLVVFAGMTEVFLTLNVLIPLTAIVVLIAVLRKHFVSGRLKTVSMTTWILSIGAFVTACVTGKDSGYSGRLFVPLLPFLLIAIVALCRSALPEQTRFNALLNTMVLSQSLTWLFVAVYLPPSLASIDRFRQQAIAADIIRVALHKQTLEVMLPDVGGSSLYGEHLTILDSALLSNAELARTGWSGFSNFFQSTKPDIFDTHGLWATFQNAYSGDLLKNYSIVGVNGRRFFVRNDLFGDLLTRNVGEVLPVDQSEACLGWPGPADQEFSRTKRVCLVFKTQ